MKRSRVVSRFLSAVVSVVVSLLVGATFGCVGTTGGDLVGFPAYARGAADGPIDFTTSAGWRVTLTRARLHVGAVYLNQSVPLAGAQATSCILPGVYVAEVTTGIDVDVLSSARQPFPVPGEGTSGLAPTGEVWLTGGDVNAEQDPTLIVDVAGTAERGGESLAFEGGVSIGKNRATGSTSSAQPGASPICKQRIVSPIPAGVTVRKGGALVLTVDPRPWFASVDFATLQRAAGSTPRVIFDDAGRTDGSRALYTALHKVQGVYRFSFE